MFEKQFEDELVRIEAESEEALRKGFKNGKLKVPNYVTLLSRAKKVMDEFVAEMTEYGGYDGKKICFDVYACRDDVLLFCYMNGEVFNDHRNDERPKSLEKVHFHLMHGGKTPPVEVRGEEKTVYAEWAEREMNKYLSLFFLKCELVRRSGYEPEELKPDDLFFDVYDGKSSDRYLYSYKNGEKFTRPLATKKQRGLGE